MEESDRISKLPDDILHRILYSIKLKQAVQTRVLSKRWKNLSSSLRFNNRRAINICKGSMGLQRLVPDFEHFVTDFLSRRDNSPISEFQLSVEAVTEPRFVESCIDYAVDHGVQILHIDTFCPSTPFKFPDRILASKTLRVLRLRQYYTGSGRVVVPKPFVLPNLETLYLEGFKFNDDGDDIYSLPKEPFSGFLDLEELTLSNCDVSDMIISAQKLNFLEISFREMSISRETKMERISAPKLTSFRHEGPISLVCPEIDFPCLEELYLDVYPYLSDGYYSRHSDGMEDKMPKNLDTMLHQLRNAKFVTLTFNTIELLAAMDPYFHVRLRPSPFPNIQCLNIKRGSYQTEALPGTVVIYLTKDSPYAVTVGEVLPRWDKRRIERNGSGPELAASSVFVLSV